VAQSVQPCHLYGDSDIYGIGIRLSFYIQWGTIILALIAGVEDEIKSTRRGFNVVSLAVLVNTFISATNGSFAALELFIVSTLVVFLSLYFIVPFGGEINVQYEEDPNQIGHPMLVSRETDVDIFSIEAFKADPIGIAILLLIDTAFLFSQPWLYWIVIKQGNRSECKPSVWVFFKSIILNGPAWIRFLRAFSVFAVIFGIIATIVAVWTLIYGISEEQPSPNVPVAFQGFIRRRIRNTDLEANMRNWRNRWCIPSQDIRDFFRHARKNLIRLLAAAGGSFFIAFVEMTIKINNIDLSNAPLTATSQLLPFLVGVFSAVSLIWACFRKIEKERNIEVAVMAGGTLQQYLDERRGGN
jgi:hypothetical protein